MKQNYKYLKIALTLMPKLLADFKSKIFSYSGHSKNFIIFSCQSIEQENRKQKIFLKMKTKVFFFIFRAKEVKIC